MTTGTVKWFNQEKGYGFIQPDNKGDKDVFVHITALRKAGFETLEQGQKITYEAKENQGRLRAQNIAA